MRKIILILIAFGFLNTASYVFASDEENHDCHKTKVKDCTLCGDSMSSDLAD